MTDTTTAREEAGQAAEAIRTLNHLSLPADGAPGLEYPSDVYDIVANLKIAAQRMPQLFGQLSQWLGDEYQAGKVGHDSREDAGVYVATVRDALDVAETAATALEDALDRAHNACAGLSARDAAG